MVLERNFRFDRYNDLEPVKVATEKDYIIAI